MERFKVYQKQNKYFELFIDYLSLLGISLNS